MPFLTTKSLESKQHYLESSVESEKLESELEQMEKCNHNFEIALLAVRAQYKVRIYTMAGFSAI